MTTLHQHLVLAAVSQRVDDHPDRHERRDALDQALLRLLAGLGITPLPVPNSLTAPDRGGINIDAWLERTRPDVLVLSGGNNIGANAERDSTECYLLDWAYAHRAPVLGICRGMQMMAHWASAPLKEVAGHVRTRHRLVTEGTNADGWPDVVNSFHRQAVAACPKDFEITARGDDGSIEAIRHRTHPWEGWMWHPEREQPFSQTDMARLRALFFTTTERT